jgi:CrcB protein
VARAPVLAVISAGGALGALVRWAVTQAWPSVRTGFPSSVLLVNATGCVLIGVLMVLVNEVWSGQRLLRPFLGVGVLGGYTTFSTYAVDVVRLVDSGAAAAALGYLVATPLAALVSVWAGVVATRGVLRLRRGR